MSLKTLVASAPLPLKATSWESPDEALHCRRNDGKQIATGDEIPLREPVIAIQTWGEVKRSYVGNDGDVGKAVFKAVTRFSFLVFTQGYG